MCLLIVAYNSTMFRDYTQTDPASAFNDIQRKAQQLRDNGLKFAHKPDMDLSAKLSQAIQQGYSNKPIRVSYSNLSDRTARCMLQT